MSQSNLLTEDVSLLELMSSVKFYLKAIIKKYFFKLIAIGFLGAIVGYFFAKIKPVTYRAEMSFMVEEGRTSSGLAAIAGQFGFDISGNTGATLFSGDNILMFLTSKSLTRETLLTPYPNAAIVNYTLADKYLEAYKLKEKWQEKGLIKEDFFFGTKKYTGKIYDSLLQIITNNILLEELTVERPEKKATFIKVDCVTRDELLAKLFCERLVRIATEKYIQSKTLRQKRNVERLERRTDSLEKVLNGRTFSTASEQEKILDVNPADRTATVKAELNNRDKIMLAQLYGEVIKNLELGKVQLSQETPTIQLVDSPEIPLIKSKSVKLLYTIAGFILSCCLAILFFGITLNRQLKKGKNISE